MGPAEIDSISKGTSSPCFALVMVSVSIFWSFCIFPSHMHMHTEWGRTDSNPNTP